MTNANKTAAAVNANLKKGNARRLMKANCKHPTTIKLHDDVQVCTCCEKVW